MIRATALCVVLSAATSVVATSAVAAPTLLVQPGIPSFDTNLGTLLSVTVTLDPPAQFTGDYEASIFENFGSHNHFVNPLPFVVPGLDTYDFPPTPTSFENPSAGQDHNHLFNLPPIVETYTGGDLAWFLNPANGVGALNVLVPPTSMTDDHNHPVNLLPVLPTTRFTYEPTAIPEPTGVALLTMAAVFASARRSARSR